jgi:hypothetical protein
MNRRLDWRDWLRSEQDILWPAFGLGLAGLMYQSGGAALEFLSSGPAWPRRRGDRPSICGVHLCGAGTDCWDPTD